MFDNLDMLTIAFTKEELNTVRNSLWLTLQDYRVSDSARETYMRLKDRLDRIHEANFEGFDFGMPDTADYLDEFEIGEWVTIISSRDLEFLECHILDALGTDGAHHKQGYLHKMAKMLGIDYDKYDYEEGVTP